ncbi:MAG: hypothetical protein COB67_08930 [SAR324 cluster bacterium]|uniref:Uncharacterized protein n=1 Tax=SAR324 cluster bacterium TaxID=2024889 RepID=A0A2A4T172_9DELT|nr:MAG: hypothetical protein COB67_08930 [SAR324 cluster bacterium]
MRGFIALLITLFIVSSIAGTGYLIFTNHDQKKELINKKLEIANLENEIQTLRNVNQNLRRQSSYRNRNNYKKSTRKTTYTTTKKQNYVKPYNPTKKREKYVPQKERKRLAELKSNKRYQKFSKSIKLVSNSRIKILRNNKLESNSAIYGRYYPNKQFRYINNINCNLKNTKLELRDECSMQISLGMDRVYLSKMTARHIRSEDYRNHMIECNYSKKYGVLHNCQSKLI